MVQREHELLAFGERLDGVRERPGLLPPRHVLVARDDRCLEAIEEGRVRLAEGMERPELLGGCFAGSTAAYGMTSCRRPSIPPDSSNAETMPTSDGAAMLALRFRAA